MSITPIAQVIVAPLAGNESEPKTRIDWFKPRKSGKLYHEDDVKQLEGSSPSDKIALDEWLTKTDWVQKTAKPGQLGMHRADIMWQRIEELTAENKKLKSSLLQMHELLKSSPDAARLDWLNNNFFNREKNKLDTALYKNSIQLVFFAPAGVQGDVRRVIDAAMTKEPDNGH